MPSRKGRLWVLNFDVHVQSCCPGHGRIRNISSVSPTSTLSRDELVVYYSLYGLRISKRLFSVLLANSLIHTHYSFLAQWTTLDSIVQKVWCMQKRLWITNSRNYKCSTFCYRSSERVPWLRWKQLGLVLEYWPVSSVSKLKTYTKQHRCMYIIIDCTLDVLKVSECIFISNRMKCHQP